MTSYQEQEEALLEALLQSAMPGVHFKPAERFGVLVIHRSKELGIWSYRNGQFQFRSLANWEPTHFAASIVAAVNETFDIIGEALG